MTTKRREVMAFFRHEPVDELPTDEGIFVLFNPEATRSVLPMNMRSRLVWSSVEI
mgnify:CR=1 FL=1